MVARFLKLDENLGKEEQLELLACYRETGDGAVRDRLVMSVAKLVAKIANEQFRTSGVDLDDLFQEGMLGVYRAVDKFDFTRSDNFAAYSAIWIRCYINRYCSKNSCVLKVPAHAMAKSRRADKFADRFREKYDREPSPELMAAALDCSLQQLSSYSRIKKNTPRFSGVGDDMLAELGCDDDVWGEVVSNEDARLLRRLICDLPFKYQKILKHRYCIEGARWMSQKDLANSLGLHPKRVSVLEDKAMAILRTRIETLERSKPT